MKQARGDARKLLQVLGEVQSLVGSARNDHYNDRSRIAFERAQKNLARAFDLCVAARSEYDIVPDMSEEAMAELLQR